MSDEIEIEVGGIDHLYLAVRDLEASERFYDGVMRLLGFRKNKGPLAGGPVHVHYFNRVLQLTLRPAEPGTADHDPTAPGLHHLCFQVVGPDEERAVFRGLQGLGVEATEPRPFPEYDVDYFATFFSDPDGIRLEVVNRHAERDRTTRDW